MAAHNDIERELYTLFTDHPASHVNDSGEPVIPADALVDVFGTFARVSNVPLLSDEETTMLKSLLADNPGLEVTPSILLQFIAEKTRNSPSPSPDLQDDQLQQQQVMDADSPHRGREQERQYSGDFYHRSSSNGSDGASHYSGSRPSSRGPLGQSPFDMERRQRSTPLNNAPSSWSSTKRPAPASRRRSIDGSTSRPDSEFSMSPTSFSRSTSGQIRTRTPSNPASPSSAFADLGGSSPFGSPTFSHPHPRPSSRSGSQSASAYTQSFRLFSPGLNSGLGLGDESLDDETVVSNALLNTSGEYRSDESFNAGISSLPMPSSSLSDSDSDDEQDSSLGLVLDRNIASSTVSMEPLERLDALQRQNADLGRKLMEAERTLQNRLAEHESELEEMQGKLEEMRSELSATKREEKELRSKERQNTTQISALELEVSKITKALESAKSTYTSLQRQYQEQCSFSEKYRFDLRAREETIRTLRESASLHELESNKWAREQQGYEERISHLEEELSVAQGVYVQLDEQKQENMLLKETIDRMRFEMDEMRANAALGLPPGGASAGGSGPGTLSKTLGAELMDKMRWEGGEGGDDEGDGKANESVEEGSSLDVPERSEDESGASVTAFEEDEDTDDEDVVQTIITRKKRKVASRAKDLTPSKRSYTFQERTSGIEAEHSINLEEVKEYSDIAIQYDPTLVCVSSGVQTLPPPIIPTSTVGTQITPPETPVRVMEVQTDPPPASPKRVTMEMEIQTDFPEDESIPATVGTATPQGEGVESLASSSSTILPPTPKPHTRSLSLGGEDEPPTYNQVAAQRAEEEKERRVVSEALARWHIGAKLRSLVASSLDHTHSHDHKRQSGRAGQEDGQEEDDRAVDGVEVEAIEGGIAEDLVEEWKALKEELGVECLVIDKILEQSTKIPRGTTPGSSSSATAANDKGKRRSGRFFNIYNTYVYGSSDGTTTTSPPSSSGQKTLATTLTNLATQTILFATASAVVFVALTPYLLSTMGPNVPGGPNAFDRAAWASFNNLGGGAGEGIAFAPRAGWLGAAGGGGGGYFDAGMGGAGDGQGTEAVWSVLQRVGGGAARMARGWPT